MARVPPTPIRRKRRSPPPGRRPASAVPVVHMVREVGHLQDPGGKKIPGAKGVALRTRCGEAGSPYDGTQGLRSTVWETEVTCPACYLPGATGIAAPEEKEEISV